MLFFLTKIQTPSDLNPADLDALPHLVEYSPIWTYSSALLFVRRIDTYLEFYVGVEGR